MDKKNNDLIIKFKNPVKFEGKEIKEVDLNSLEKLKTPDLIAAEKQYIQEGNYSAQPETTVGYTRIIAEKATNLPLEFFDNLSIKQIIKIKDAISLFFLQEE